MCLFSAVEAQAADLSWNGISGNFEDSSNWTPSGPPGITDNANFDVDASYTVDINGDTTNANLRVGPGSANIDLNSNNYYLTDGMWVNNGGTLSVENGNIQVDDELNGFGVGVDIGHDSVGQLNLINGAGCFTSS